MTESAARVVLLAREGEARDRLRQALREAGADVVAEVDPLTAAIDEVRSATPQAVLVALEPAIEDALEDWDGLLAEPDIAVIYDEAVLAASRTGWDAARWVRHLRAKLHRHDDVLPPTTGPDRAGDQAAPADPVANAGEDASADATAAGQVQTPSPGPATDAGDPAPVEEGLEAWLERMSAATQDPSGDAATDGDAGLAGDISAASEPDPGEPAAGGVAPAPVVPGFGELSLATGEDDVPLVDGRAPEAQAPDLDALEERIAGLSLVDVDAYGLGPERGAVLVEAGLGGPDAVRQLLASLEAGFPRPLLVRMRLDGGRYDRLVRQMDRATVLAVELAEEGAAIQPGHVYFLPPGISTARDRGELRFAASAADPGLLPDGLPAHDSAILLLSGSDPAVVEEALALAGRGALVIGQAPEDNFDPAATRLLCERGGSAMAPARIAAQLMERWSDSAAGARFEEQDP